MIRKFFKGIPKILLVVLAIELALAVTLYNVGVLDAHPKRVITIGLATDIEASTTADYTTDGVADSTDFQAALDALPATGGEIYVLSTGTFNFTATVSRAIDNVTISGAGLGTVMNYNGSTALFSAGNQAGWTFRDMTLDLGGITLSSATRYTLQNVKIGTTYYAYRTSDDITSVSLGIPTGRDATFTIAASDSSALDKTNADYVCDGTADDVQIAAAYTALPVTGGKVKLLEGTFYMHAGVTPIVNSITTGTGNGTIIKLEDSHNAAIVLFTVSANYVTINNMQINGNSAAQASGNDDAIAVTGTNCTVRDVYIHHFNHYGINATGSSNSLTVDHCKITNSYTAIQAYDDNTKVMNCTIDTITAATGAIEIYQAANYYVANNTISNAVFGIDVNQGDGSKYGAIVGNTVSSCSDTGISLNTVVGATVTSNQVYTCVVGIRDYYGVLVTISSNIVNNSLRHGIYVYHNSSANSIVAHNMVRGSGSETDNTYSGIAMEAGTAVEICDNIIRQGDNANRPSYGINVIGANAVKTYVHGNDLYDSGKTGSLNDAGTTTIKRDNINLAGTAMLADS